MGAKNKKARETRGASVNPRLTLLRVLCPDRIGAVMYNSTVTWPGMQLFGFPFVSDNTVITGVGNVSAVQRVLWIPTRTGFVSPCSQHLIMGWKFNAPPEVPENIPANPRYICFMAIGVFLFLPPTFLASLLCPSPATTRTACRVCRVRRSVRLRDSLRLARSTTAAAAIVSARAMRKMVVLVCFIFSVR